jgi:hypothetical protein
MSALINNARGQARALLPEQSGILRVVGSASAKPRPRVFYAIVTVAVVIGIIISQILLSVAVSAGAYEISDLKGQQKDLSRTYTQVSQNLAEASSPQHLAASAEALGMVTSNTTAYLRLSNSKILGQAHPASRSGALLRGANGSLVQNILLTDIPAGSVPAASRASGNIQTVGVAAGTPAGTNVALPGASAQTIPTPQTR